ncbi:biotin [Bifidobacterium dentium]|nr:biotin [Bifidobacterium dentium]NEG52298.1 biotin [Bifidobacterium dentium]
MRDKRPVEHVSPPRLSSLFACPCPMRTAVRPVWQARPIVARNGPATGHGVIGFSYRDLSGTREPASRQSFHSIAQHAFLL